MKALGAFTLLGAAGIALYGYVMMFGPMAAFIVLCALPLGMLAYPFVYAGYSGIFPWLYVALLVIGGLMLYKSEEA